MPVLSDKYRNSSDRRAIRSRASIIRALNKLLLDDAVHDLSVNAVVEAAGVGRSTFYEHFGNLDALIQAAITPMFDDLASTNLNPGLQNRQQLVLDHLWTKRRLARILLVGRRAEKMTEVLATSYMKALTERSRTPTIMTDADRLTATYLAAGTINILRDWLTGRVGSDSKMIASVLARQAACSHSGVR